MILWADSFDHYGDTETNMTDGAWAEVSGSARIETAQSRTGARSMFLFNNSEVRRVFGAAKVTAGVAAAFFMADLPAGANTTHLFRFRDAANATQVTITVDTTGVISVWRGANVTSLGVTSGPVLTASAWNHVEAKVLISDTVGTVEVRVNGVTVINLTGQDTKASSLTETSQVACVTNGLSTAGFYVDDIIGWDTTGSLNNDFVGDLKVQTDFPDADTADVAWTRSTGSTNFGVIDENPPNADTDYLTTTTLNAKFGVSFPDLPVEATLVPAVIFVHKSKKTDAGDGNIQLHLQSNGDTANGTDRPMTTAYTLYHDVFETDPDTAAPWTRAAAQLAALQGERTL